MGLDVAELVMEVEDEFGIQITYEDYPKLITVGNLCDLVAVRLEGRASRQYVDSSFCRSAGLFLWLRQGLRTVLERPNLRVRPSDRLDLYLSRKTLPTVWPRWASECNLRLPALVHPYRLDIILLDGGVLLVLAAIFSGLWLGLTGGPLWMSDTLLGLALFSVLGSLVTGLVMLGMRVAIPGRAIPDSLVTFRDVVRAIDSTRWQQWQALNLNGAAEQREEIWRRVRKIINKQLNIPIPEIQPESRFVEDLGCD